MDIFAPYAKINGCFIVKNVSPQIKTIFIFNYPINYLAERDLLDIPGVSEQDIRASLLKGVINHKIRSGDIEIICSDIDLLQFNSNQKTFLQAAGVINGLSIGSDQLSVIEMQDIMLDGAVDGYNLIYTIPSGTWIQQAPYKIIVYKNGVKQVAGDDFTIQESGGSGTGYDTVIFTVAPTVHPSPIDIITADYYMVNT